MVLTLMIGPGVWFHFLRRITSPMSHLWTRATGEDTTEWFLKHYGHDDALDFVCGHIQRPWLGVPFWVLLHNVVRDHPGLRNRHLAVEHRKPHDSMAEDVSNQDPSPSNLSSKNCCPSRTPDTFPGVAVGMGRGGKGHQLRRVMTVIDPWTLPLRPDTFPGWMQRASPGK